MRTLVLRVLGIALVFGSTVVLAQRPSGYEYAAKFICGRSDGRVVAPGMYFTAINVQNPNDKGIGLNKKFVIALPAETPGPVSKPHDTKLGPDQAMEIDCPDIVKRSEAKAEFLKGFVIIRSELELNVVAVYTAAGATKQVETLAVERVVARNR